MKCLKCDHEDSSQSFCSKCEGNPTYDLHFDINEVLGLSFNIDEILESQSARSPTTESLEARQAKLEAIRRRTKVNSEKRNSENVRYILKTKSEPSKLILNANYFAIPALIIFCLLIVNAGGNGSARLTVFLMASGIFFAIFYVTERWFSNSRSPSRAIKKALIFSVFLMLFISLRNCAARSPHGGESYMECEPGIGGVPICRRTY